MLAPADVLDDHHHHPPAAAAASNPAMIQGSALPLCDRRAEVRGDGEAEATDPSFEFSSVAGGRGNWFMDGLASGWCSGRRNAERIRSRIPASVHERGCEDRLDRWPRGHWHHAARHIAICTIFPMYRRGATMMFLLITERQRYAILIRQARWSVVTKCIDGLASPR